MVASGRRTSDAWGGRRLLLIVLWWCVSVRGQGYDVPKKETVSSSNRYVGESRTRCYDDTGKAQRCIPGFENAAFSVRVEATNTCGENGPIEFCVQTGTSIVKKSCEACYEGSGPDSHPAEYLTDFNNNENQTWWQSETMFEGIQYPSQVNLTLRLKKAFDITYVRLWFYSPRPESFAIYRRMSEDGDWLPYQFYSATCRDTYGLPDVSYARKGPEETRALCTSEYSDISPLRGGNVAFSTLEGRPSAYNFDTSPELQEWVTATDIRITLDRLNTFGDEVFGDGHVLRSYFYAISDFAVGARCKCNGHASECVNSSASDGSVRRVCRCEHNTAGPDCNECLPFYNDVPWGRASALDAHECRACNCNGFSNRCYFDKELYDRTGHGGHCLDCRGNKEGPNCERCKENYYQREQSDCVACNCNEIGSRSLQCNSEGRCQCKPGVTGEKCDRCAINYFDFGTNGCKPCGCNEAGSWGNKPNCDPYQGTCQCKENVEGKRCGSCKPGFFNLDENNEFGCTPCFCYGHTSRCNSAAGYSKVIIESVFARGNERWSGVDRAGRVVPIQYQAITQSIGASAPIGDFIYFSAPDRFLSDQRASYNQDIFFKLRIGDNGPSPTVQDVVLEGAGLTIAQAIFGQGNPLPRVMLQEFKFRLHEHPDYGWQPRLTSRDFMSVLSNLTAIKIRGTYTPEGIGYLDDVRLETARRGAAGKPANWVESCECLQGYVGQYCESCAPGYRHEPANGGAFAPCVPCNCNSHADICDADTGRCICQHNTGGDNCERCARGYYGNALQGTAYDCKLCPCPNQGACMQLLDETVVCLECPKGYGGPRCDLCSDGYFGDPTGRFGPVRLCQPCDCNENVDPNAVGNCNRTTGECLKCIYNTGGFECDQCIPGYYGDALAVPKGDCEQCQCYPAGTLETSEGGSPVCDQLTGQCQCKDHVVGKNCDECEDGYYNIRGGEGCQACSCNPEGSKNHSCNLYTGQCECQTGVAGLRCDHCEAYQYGFSAMGCKACDCDQIGSVSLQCDPFGQCECLENVEGRQCERCKENKYDRQRGCVDCPACYNLVQNAVTIHRAKLAKLKEVLSGIASDPTVINDENFERKLTEVQDKVEELWQNAKEIVGGDDKSLLEHMTDLRNKLAEVEKLIGQLDKKVDQAKVGIEQGEHNITEADETINRAMQALKDALDYVETDGSAALQKAVERSNQFGQQSEQMTNIAKEARLLAQDHEDNAEKILDLAKKALNTSTAAYDLAKNAINQQKNISDELKVLRHDMDDVTEKLELAKELAKRTSDKVGTAHTTALDVLREIKDLIIPDVDIPKLKEDANVTRQEAQKIKDEAEDLLAKNNELLQDLEDHIDRAKELLEQGIEQQQQTDELLADADAALAKAENATAMGDQTLKEAQETYNTLTEFDNQVQENKEKAQNALANVPEIERLIYEAENKTQDAKRALIGAVGNAQNARDTAQEAQQKYAEQASQEADKIRQDADQAKSDAGKLRDEADALESRVAVTEKRVAELEEQAVTDEKLTTEAKNTVGQAKSDAAEATKQVNKALLDVQNIIDELKILPALDEEALNELEKKLAAAEDEFNAANLDERMATLKNARILQNQWMKNYQEEVEKLRAEVINIEAIHSSLPDGCWKRVQLEP